MTHAICPQCGSRLWRWEEAFDKFGFDDGDGHVMTETVAATLREAGYDVTTLCWGMHNVIIDTLARHGRSCIRRGATVGYDDPRTYLLKKVIRLLDKVYNPDDEEVQP